MTQNFGISDEVLLTGRVASGDITDDAELRKELEKIYPTENWSDINRLMKAMKTRAVRQSGGTTEVVGGEIVHKMGQVVAEEQLESDLKNRLDIGDITQEEFNTSLESGLKSISDLFTDPQGRTHGQDVSVQVGTDSDGNRIMQNYAYYAPVPHLGIEGGVIHVPKDSTFQREYLGMINTAKSNKATADAKAIADAAAPPVETPVAPISGIVDGVSTPDPNPFVPWYEYRTDPVTGERTQVQVPTPSWMMDEYNERIGKSFPMTLPGAPDLGKYAFWHPDYDPNAIPAEDSAYWTDNYDQYGNFIGDVPANVVDPSTVVDPTLGTDISGAEMAMLEAQGNPWWWRDSPTVDPVISTVANTWNPSSGTAGVNNWNIISEKGYEPWQGIDKGENIGGGYNRNNNVGYNPSVATGDGMAFDWSTYNPDSPFQGSPVFGEYTPQQQYTSLQSTRIPEYYMPGYSSMAQRGYAPTFGSFLLGGYGQNQGTGLGQGTRFADWFTGGGREPSNITGGWNQALAFSNMMPGGNDWNRAQGVSPGMAYAMQDPDAVQAMALSRYYGGGVPQSSYASRAVASSLGDLYNRFTARGIQQGNTGPSSYLGYLSNLDPTRWGAYA